MSTESTLKRLGPLSFWIFLAALIPLSVLAQDRDRPESEERERWQSEPTVHLSRSLREVMEGKRPLESVFVEVVWRRGEEMVTAQIYGNGIGVWNKRAQLRLTRKDLLDLLESFEKSSFVRMPPQLGEGSDMLKLQGKVSLTIGRETQIVHQLATGDQSEEIANLAAEILDLAEARGKEGVSASSLSDGLKKLTAGKLAPEALQLTAVRRKEMPGEADSSDPEDGWLLRVTGRRAEVQLFHRGRGYDPAREATLTEAEFRALLENLVRADLADLPQNAYAAQYTDVTVQVLDQVKDIAARRYADITPRSHGEKQKTFDRLYSELRQLTKRVLEGGRAAPAAD